jgi:hypothetical protein
MEVLHNLGLVARSTSAITGSHLDEEKYQVLLMVPFIICITCREGGHKGNALSRSFLMLMKTPFFINLQISDFELLLIMNERAAQLFRPPFTQL